MERWAWWIALGWLIALCLSPGRPAKGLLTGQSGGLDPEAIGFSMKGDVGFSRAKATPMAWSISPIPSALSVPLSVPKR